MNYDVFHPRRLVDIYFDIKEEGLFCLKYVVIGGPSGSTPSTIIPLIKKSDMVWYIDRSDGNTYLFKDPKKGFFGYTASRFKKIQFSQKELFVQQLRVSYLDNEDFELPTQQYLVEIAEEALIEHL